MDDPTVAQGASQAPHERAAFLPGTVVSGRYRIVALIGQGGMGEVYRADDLKIGQPVALKFLPPDFERHPDRLQRLFGEVRIARQVSHPNVCRVYDVGDTEGHPFITMEYVDGEDLAALLRRIGRLPQEKALDLTRQIAAGLAAAHVQGIVHRDLKPANVLVDGRGRARITDFGLAVVAETVRGREARSGSPGYMAPEQIEGATITARTDVYALGLLTYEMFTGKQPAPGTRPSGLDATVDALVLRCLEADPARRPASAMEFLLALPGGDPLEAALKAGETPSPEMVAAAGEERALSPGMAWGLLGLGLLLSVAACLAAVRDAPIRRAVRLPEQPPTDRSQRAADPDARRSPHVLHWGFVRGARSRGKSRRFRAPRPTARARRLGAGGADRLGSAPVAHGHPRRRASRRAAALDARCRL
jgi:serine/threonine-protein kinase